MDGLASEIQIGGGAARRTIQGSQEMFAVGPAGESSGTRVCVVDDVFRGQRDVSMASRARTLLEYSLGGLMCLM
jgi:hypothetical protein